MASTTYRYVSPEAGHHHAYLFQPVLRQLIGRKRIFDLGCGNGAIAAKLDALGFDVAGVDPSESGIEQARRAYPSLNLQVGSAYDDLASRFGAFDAVISLEVVEHVYDPRSYARNLFDLVASGGIAVVSTPYHGYFKNLALAVTGKMDAHHGPLWDGGHIKFWSVDTLRRLLSEVGFIDISMLRVGRIPSLAKSMIAVAHKT